jgi:hypothetical protein
MHTKQHSLLAKRFGVTKKTVAAAVLGLLVPLGLTAFALPASAALPGSAIQVNKTLVSNTGFTPGSTFTYGVEVRNNTDDVLGVADIVAEDIPGPAFDSAVVWSSLSQGATVGNVWTVGPLAPGAKAIATVTTTVAPGNVLTTFTNRFYGENAANPYDPAGAVTVANATVETDTDQSDVVSTAGPEPEVPPAPTADLRVLKQLTDRDDIEFVCDEDEDTDDSSSSLSVRGNTDEEDFEDCDLDDEREKTVRVFWRLTVANLGAVTARNTVVTDDLPEEAIDDSFWVRHDPVVGSFDEDEFDEDDIDWTIGDLGPGATATVVVAARFELEDLDDGVVNRIRATSTDSLYTGGAQDNKTLAEDTDQFDRIRTEWEPDKDDVRDAEEKIADRESDENVSANGDLNCDDVEGQVDTTNGDSNGFDADNDGVGCETNNASGGGKEIDAGLVVNDSANASSGTLLPLAAALLLGVSALGGTTLARVRRNSSS